MSSKIQKPRGKNLTKGHLFINNFRMASATKNSRTVLESWVLQLSNEV